MLLQDAIRLVRAKVNEPAYPTLPGSTAGNPPARLYTDTELTDWINFGLQDLARRAEWLYTTDRTISIPAYGENPAQPVPTYPLPQDVYRIYRVEFQVYNDSSQIYPLEASNQAYMDQIWNIDQLSTRYYPSYFVTQGYPGGTGRNTFVIQIFPNPAQRGNLNLYYYRQPVKIADPVANPTLYTVTLDLMNGWDDLLIDFVHVQALMKARNPDYQTVLQMYEQKMVNVIDMTRRFNDQAQYLQYDMQPMGWGDFGAGGLW